MATISVHPDPPPSERPGRQLQCSCSRRLEVATELPIFGQTVCIRVIEHTVIHVEYTVPCARTEECLTSHVCPRVRTGEGDLDGMGHAR